MAQRSEMAVNVSLPWPPEVPPPWQPTPDIPWPYPHPPDTQPPAEPPRRPRLPEWWEPPAHWADLETQLLDRRIVLLSGQLDRATANRAVAAIMLLDARSAEPIEIRISCADGELESAMTLAETIDLARAPIRAVGSGTIGGPAVIGYAAAERRLAYPHCVFHLREPHLAIEGRADEIVLYVDQYQQQLARSISRLAVATGQPVATVDSDVRTGRMLSADDAVAYGLVHEVVGGATRKA